LATSVSSALLGDGPPNAFVAVASALDADEANSDDVSSEVIRA
jgi:hypothetical protein